MSTQITIQTTVHAPVEKVWAYWNEPEHITHWAFASDDWCAPRATNDLRDGGTFTTRMEAKDSSFGFDFGGTYTSVVPQKYIAYTIGDGRKVEVTFESVADGTVVTETFEAENENPVEMQKTGWQAILDNFKKYTEA